jgi:hypothetical protein
MTGMLSAALLRWNGDRLAEVDRARRLSASAPRGTRHEIAVADLHLVAYLAVCCAEFQAFSSELYQNSVGVIATCLASDDSSGRPRTRSPVGLTLINSLVAQTRLDAGNPTTSNLIKDFDRLSINLRAPVLHTRGPATARYCRVLDVEILATRNALFRGAGRLADLTTGSPPSPVNLRRIDDWVGTLQRMATTMDGVVGHDLGAAVVGPAW